ncbi:MAG: SdpI family protein, partial [Cyanobacteria bacterium P01_G01_bin.38]
INAVIIVGMLALSVWAWWQLPSGSQVPTHFNIQGVPDRYGGKAEGLLLLPLITLGIMLINLAIPKIAPHQQNIKRSGQAYAVISVGIVAFMSIVHIVIISSALGKSVNVNAVLSIAMGLLFIVLGNYLSKIRRNYFLGVRTPWTLSSELAWHRTHRLASWLFILHGFAFVVSGLLSSRVLLSVLVVSILICSLLVLPGYSYLLWRSDANRSID